MRTDLTSLATCSKGMHAACRSAEPRSLLLFDVESSTTGQEERQQILPDIHLLQTLAMEGRHKQLHTVSFGITPPPMHIGPLEGTMHFRAVAAVLGCMPALTTVNHIQMDNLSVAMLPTQLQTLRLEAPFALVYASGDNDVWCFSRFKCLVELVIDAEVLDECLATIPASVRRLEVHSIKVKDAADTSAVQCCSSGIFSQTLEEVTIDVLTYHWHFKQLLDLPKLKHLWIKGCTAEVTANIGVANLQLVARDLECFAWPIQAFVEGGGLDTRGCAYTTFH